MAKKNCRICHGSGTVIEDHGTDVNELIDCECAFEDIPDSFEIQNKIDNGWFKVVPYESKL